MFHVYTYLVRATCFEDTTHHRDISKVFKGMVMRDGMLAMFGINGAFYTFSASISLFMRQEQIGDDTSSGIVVCPNRMVSKVRSAMASAKRTSARRNT